MSCRAPIPSETLVAYWAGDLDDAETDRVDEHLMGCASCSAAAERLAPIVSGLRSLIPPVVDRATLDQLRASGMRVQENTFLPNQRQTAFFPEGLDLLVHRLTGLDLSNVERVDVTVKVESTGEVLVEAPHAPFDAREGVLIACQRHFQNLPADTVFEVRAVATSGAERLGVYTIPHVF